MSTTAPGILGISTPLEVMKGNPYRLIGANKKERMFLLKDDQGNQYLFQVDVSEDRKKITAIRQIEEIPDELPRGLDREEPLGEVIISHFNKQDNLQHAQPAGADYSQAQWNKGYVFMDRKHGHPWLRIGVYNYTNRPRVRFEWNFVGDEDDEEA